MNKFIKDFKKDGYVILPPYSILNKKEIDHILDLFNQNIPKYIQGKVKPKDPKFYKFNLYFNRFLDIRFKTNFFLGNINFDGCALRHAYLRGNGSIISENDRNIFFGKRATLAEIDFPKRLVEYIENKKILALFKNFLGANLLSFHNGSMNAVFPGCVGEPKQFHIDTPAYSKSRLDIVDSNRYIVAACIFLSDITNNLAPFRLIPGSHRKYKLINSTLSKSYKKNPNQNNIPQATGDLWEEILPSKLKKSINITGKKGSIVLFRSDIIHGATENKSNQTRKTLFLSFSNRNHNEFSAKIFHEKEKCLKFYSSFHDKALVKKSFKDPFKMNFVNIKRKIKSKLRLILNFIKNNWKIPLKPVYRFIKKFRPQIHIDKKNYLNIGSGPFWRHPKVIGLDYDPKISEISFDLNNKSNLPFHNDRFNGVYTSHCLEHLQEKQVLWILKEVYRVLTPNGILRITVPDILTYLDAYDSKNASYFDWSRGKYTYRFDSWLRLIVRCFAEAIVDFYSDDELIKKYKTKKSREHFLNYFSNKVDKINDKRFLLPGSHKSWWSGQKMKKVLISLGFRSVKIMEQKKSRCKLFEEKIFNNNTPSMSFYIEGIK